MICWRRGTQNAAYTRESWSDTEPVCAVRPVSFAYYMSETSEEISLDNLVRKNNTLHHYPASYSPSRVYRLATIQLQAVTSKYSNCISYNFFIFCPICMKFSHNVLHTYSFILCVKKRKVEICENRVVMPRFS